MTDWIDKLLAFGTIFDYISPIRDELQGYNRCAYETRNYQDAVSYAMQLEKQGIKARVAGSPLSGYMVVTK